MLRYKLVTQDYKTRKGQENETTWEIGKTVTAESSSIELCSAGVIHSYETPELAVLLNPIHANIQNPRLLVIECSEIVAQDWGKAGHKSVTAIKEIPLPIIGLKQKIAFSILCSLAVYKDPKYVIWANNWLSNFDNTTEAAEAAADVALAAETAAEAARFASAQAAALASRTDAEAAARTAARTAAEAVARTAQAAAQAAAQADAQAAARIAATRAVALAARTAAEAAALAARTAADAAALAATKITKINFATLAQQCLNY
jgi:hypothetical protein